MEKKPRMKEGMYKEEIVRILATDIPGNSSVYAGLTKIKGIGWTFSNAVCAGLKIDKHRKINSLSEEEIGEITAFIKNPQMPSWILNRKRDVETGQSKHLITAELDLAKEFDIRKMKKIRSYKGWRHATGQPVRGQRTKSHFRKGRAIGVAKGKQREAMRAAGGEKK